MRSDIVETYSALAGKTTGGAIFSGHAVGTGRVRMRAAGTLLWIGSRRPLDPA
jgi:hypothetical protein